MKVHGIALVAMVQTDSTLGKVHLGKYTWESTPTGRYTWEGTLKKVHPRKYTDACVKCKRAQSELPVAPGSGSSWVTCASQVRAAGCSNTRT